jgi:glycine dehydrogenase subunit 1
MYFYNTEEDQRQMLETIGAGSIAELFRSIPSQMQLNRPLNLPPALSELELAQHMQCLAAKNAHAGNKVCFLGGGSYDHFIPAVVDALAGRGEFYTSYTPYQPEVSQGNLQAMFEYQTLICELTGMDVSNASLYDGGSAAVEAALLCMSVTKREKKVVTLGSVNPEYREILKTYFTCIGAELVAVDCPNGAADVAAVSAAIDDQTACVLVQHPNFFGCLEEVEQLAKAAHEKGALLVVSADPISLGLLKRPGDLGADVFVAEGQSLGSPMAFGGPYLGIMACQEKFVRRMPGRIAGQTVDRRGRRCWVLTLQTREQHIRREKATSNICTNQGLFALRAAIYLSALGPRGLREVAENCVRKARFASETLVADDRFELAFNRPTFKEFVIRDRQGKVAELLSEATDGGVLAGLPLGKWYPELSDCFLVAVTEKRTKREIELLADVLSKAGVQGSGFRVQKAEACGA